MEKTNTMLLAEALQERLLEMRTTAVISAHTNKVVVEVGSTKKDWSVMFNGIEVPDDIEVSVVDTDWSKERPLHQYVVV